MNGCASWTWLRLCRIFRKPVRGKASPGAEGYATADGQTHFYSGCIATAGNRARQAGLAGFRVANRLLEPGFGSRKTGDGVKAFLDWCFCRPRPSWYQRTDGASSILV